MTKREKLKLIHDRLFAVYGDLDCPLEHRTPFQLMVAVVLSAQCTDKRVNLVTPELFRRYPDPGTFAKATPEEIEQIIQSCGLAKSKSRNLVAAARMLTEEFMGEIPTTMEQLIRLPGIGRKSANVLLGNAFGIPGFPVDTHVTRLVNLIGIADSDSPEAIEKILNKNVPPEHWTNYSHLLIQHGRRVCVARRPKCNECAIKDLCNYGKNIL